MLFEDVSRRDPANARVWFMLSALHGQQGDFDAAIRCGRRAVEIDPQLADAHYNLAQAYMHLHRYAEAADAYRRVVGIVPAHVVGWQNLGCALRAQGRLDEALHCLKRAIDIDPRATAVCQEIGSLLSEADRHAEALEYLQRAAVLRPDQAAAHSSLGNCLRVLGRFDDARHAFERALALDPRLDGARYYLAALGAAPVPGSTPADFVKGVYRHIAQHYDQTHTGLRLGYRVPDHLFDLVRRARGAAPAPEIVDIGCGTGLCGSVFRPMAARLVGIDLVEEMLVEARKKNVYDELLCGELTQILAGHAAAFDVAVAAGVFIHIGDLRPVFESCRAALRPGGVFAFSTHEHDGDGFRLQPTGHYAHAPGHVTRIAAAAGFMPIAAERVQIYQNARETVHGHVQAFRVS